MLSYIKKGRKRKEKKAKVIQIFLLALPYMYATLREESNYSQQNKKRNKTLTANFAQ
jgi:hypothetical protein